MMKTLASLKKWALTLAFSGAVAALVVSAPFLHTAKAQVPSTNPPYNTTLGALITNALRVPSTVNSAQQNNLDKTGAICVFNASTISGSPSVTLNLQNYDSASASYYTILTSGSQAITANTPIVVMVHDGIQTASLPSGVTATAGIPLARYWRVQQVLTGSNTAATGTTGCDNIK